MNSSPCNQDEPSDGNMTQAELFQGIREMLAQSRANPHPHRFEDDIADQTFEDGLNAFFDSIDLIHPGLFDPEQETQDGERLREARPSDPRSDVGIVVASFMSEITVGMGSFAHTHFDIDQADQALGLIGCLARGETGCLEARKRDGSIQWGRFMAASELDAPGGPALSNYEHVASARFFGASRDIDFF